jgi:hypothetical protein
LLVADEKTCPLKGGEYIGRSIRCQADDLSGLGKHQQTLVFRLARMAFIIRFTSRPDHHWGKPTVIAQIKR